MALNRLDFESDSGGHRHPNRLGVIDIGSNSVRLVIFEGHGRAPMPILNEKALCGLALGVRDTGALSQSAMDQVFQSLDRFFELIRATDTTQLEIVATAAVRDASNGAEFTEAVHQRHGHRVKVLTGADEARISAAGVLGSFPEADGFVGDLGGGSLEVSDIVDGAVSDSQTFPLGALRLPELRADSLEQISRQIDRQFEREPWIRNLRGRKLYAVGGAWRSIARAHMEHADYPLQVIHGYRLRRVDAMQFAELLAKMSASSGMNIGGVSKQRVSTLPLSALVLSRLLEIGEPDEVVFSAHGLREGCLYERLSPEDQRSDPLIVCSAEISRKSSRNDPDVEALMKWLAPACTETKASDQRLLEAICLLSDICWSEHPRYRGQHAYLRILRLPIVGLSHEERVFIACTILVRYTGGLDPNTANGALRLLDEEYRAMALRIGTALRLGLTLCGGAFELLDRVPLIRNGDRFELMAEADERLSTGDTIRRRLADLNRTG